MKMEYERYSERYRRNETNGNVGIISEDSEVIRRRTMLQEQQREELQRNERKSCAGAEGENNGQRNCSACVSVLPCWY